MRFVLNITGWQLLVGVQVVLLPVLANVGPLLVNVNEVFKVVDLVPMCRTAGELSPLTYYRYGMSFPPPPSLLPMRCIVSALCCVLSGRAGGGDGVLWPGLRLHILWLFHLHDEGKHIERGGVAAR